MVDLQDCWPHLADVDIATIRATHVSLIIGMDNPMAHEVYAAKADRRYSRSPRAHLTPSGRCVVGSLGPPDSLQCNNITEQPNLEELVQRFFEEESLGVLPSVNALISAEERRALEILQAKTVFRGDRSEAGLLRRDDDPCLPNHRAMALRGLNSLERHLMKDTETGRRYSTVMQEYVTRPHSQAHDGRGFQRAGRADLMAPSSFRYQFKQA